MEKKKSLTLVGVGVLAAAALGVTGATLANAADEPAASTTSSTAAPSTGSGSGSTTSPKGGTSGGTLPGGGVQGQDGQGPDGDGGPHGGPGGMFDDGGKLTADAAGKAIAAAEAKVSGGTASSVRATSSGTYVVDVLKSDGTEVHVLLDAKFAVTSVETGGMGGRGGPGGAPGGAPGTGSSGSTNPSDANGTSSSST